METLKQPAMVLSIANSLGLIALGVYGQRQFSELKENMGIVTKLAAILNTSLQEKSDSKNLKEVLNLIGAHEKTLNVKSNKIEKLQEMVDDLEDKLETIQEAFEQLTKEIKTDGSITVSVPSFDVKKKKGKKNVKKGKKYENDTSDDESSDEEAEDSPPPRRRRRGGR